MLSCCTACKIRPPEACGLTCKGGCIDDEFRVKGVCVAEGVSQDESALGIGVINLQKGELTKQRVTNAQG